MNSSCSKHKDYQPVNANYVWHGSLQLQSLLLWSIYISADKIVCGYSPTLKIVTDAEFHQSTSKLHAYAVNVKKGWKAMPTSLEPSSGNLGLFCNGCLPTDHFRTKANAYLSVAFSKAWPQGLRICIKAKKRIYVGDEIILNYGKGYNTFLLRCIREKEQV